MNTWQDIDTAPTDGTPILACHGEHYRKHGRLPVVISWRTFHPNAQGAATWRDVSGHKQERIDLWQPLPAPPTTP